MSLPYLRRHSCKFLFLPAILLTSLLPTLAWAQDLDDATIAGQVSDETGAVIPGATITALLQATKEERKVRTDSDGRYRLMELEPGTYRVRAESAGFATEEKRDLLTVAGQNVELSFRLRPAAVIADEVLVSEADAPPVDTTRTLVGGTLVPEEIERLPNASRSPLDLIFTLGGVTEEPLSTRDLAEDRNTSTGGTPEEAGVFALSGGPAYSNNITIDGLDNNDDRAARERFQPSLEAVEELQVIRNQFSAEYGRASGGRINLRTRAGGSLYRGRAFMFFRDDILDANTFRNKLNGLPRLPLTEYNPGLTFGGPLKIGSKLPGVRPNSAFFFTGFEYSKLTETATIDTVVPVEENAAFPLPRPTTLVGRRAENGTQAEVAPFFSAVATPLSNLTLTARIDVSFSAAHNATIGYQLGRLKNLRGFPGGNRLAEALTGRRRNTYAVSYADNYIFSARAVNQLRLQFSRLTPAVEAAGGHQPVVLISLNVPAAEGDPVARTGTLLASSSTTGATDRRETRYQAQDTFSFITGRHSLRFGADLQRISSTFIDLSDASGTYNFASVADFLAGNPSRFRQNFQTESSQTNSYLGIFIQDEWRIRQNLVLSYGLRYERETILPDKNNFGPRLGLAYDPFKSGKTVIRLGGGIFYNRVLLRTVDDFTLGSGQFLFDTNLIPAGPERNQVLAAIGFPKVLTPDSHLITHGRVSRDSESFFRRLDPNLVIPESYQTNVGFERELGGQFVFEANYTWNRGIHLWREFNANAPLLPAGFRSFTEYLLSRDFPNLRPCPRCSRPLFNGTGAGELVRFTTASMDPLNPSAIGRVVEFGLPVTIISLNSITGTNTASQLTAALAAINSLRPDPARTEIEQLASIGNSFYHGLVVEVRRRFRRRQGGFSFSLRASYTLSFLKDDGIVNTSDALRPGDFRSERSRSLLDRRHRFAFSGTFDLPGYLFRLRLSPIVRLASGAPFNISIGGVDRNLDDVNNDRPNYSGDPRWLRARAPHEPLNPAILSAFSMPAIGEEGNLPRNAGMGPRQIIFDLSLEREFRFKDRMRLRPNLEIDNLFNLTVFSLGSEFVDFSAFGPAASAVSRQAFLDSFLVATRTLRPRALRLGLRLDF